MFADTAQRLSCAGPERLVRRLAPRWRRSAARRRLHIRLPHAAGIPGRRAGQMFADTVRWLSCAGPERLVRRLAPRWRRSAARRRLHIRLPHAAGIPGRRAGQMFADTVRWLSCAGPERLVRRLAPRWRRSAARRRLHLRLPHAAGITGRRAGRMFADTAQWLSCAGPERLVRRLAPKWRRRGPLLWLVPQSQKLARAKRQQSWTTYACSANMAENS